METGKEWEKDEIGRDRTGEGWKMGVQRREDIREHPNRLRGCGV